MSRLRRLYTLLACRTGLRTGKSVETSGSLPLTRVGTFGNYPLPDYGICGATEQGTDPTPASPVPLSCVGEAILPGGQPGLSLTFSTSDGAGTVDRKTVSFPGVEPLRAVSGVADEIGYRSGKLTRRVGVCRDPAVFSGLSDTYGTAYPSVSLLVGDGTTVASYPDLLSTHWKKIAAQDFTGGLVPGMTVKSGALYANLPRSLYRRYVKGCTGNTTAGETTLTPSVPAGEYRCDFYDGTARVFTLPDDLFGSEGCRDVLAVSRSGATLKKRMLSYAFTGEETPTVLGNFNGSGKAVFRLEKAGFGAKAEGVSAICSGFNYVDGSPQEMVWDSDDVPAFCEDRTYFYFRIPDKSLLAGFQNYMRERYVAGTPITLVYEAAEPREITLTSRLAAAATVTDVPLLPDAADDYAFDSEAHLTLVPAMREFLAEERDEGREVGILYVLPAADVTETESVLPPLLAGEGVTVFGAVSAQAGGADPVAGRFTALSEE